MDSRIVPYPSEPRRRTNWVLAAALGIVGIVLYVTVIAPGLRGLASLPPAPLAAPERLLRTDYAWDLKDLSGQPFDFASLRGKVVFLNLWASWCPPCRAEMPSIVSLSQDPRLGDVEFLLVGVSDEPSALQRSLDSLEGNRDRLRAVVAEGPNTTFASEGIPATFVLDPSGQVVLQHTGAARWDTPEVIAFLGRLAQSKSVSASRPNPE